MALTASSISVTGCLGCPQYGHGFVPSGLKLCIWRRCTGWRRAHEKIISSGDQHFVPTKELAQPTFHPIAYHRGTDALSHSQPKAGIMPLPVISIHGEISAPQLLAMTVTARKVGWDGEALGSA
jgi:hypothetical protein